MWIPLPAGPVETPNPAPGRPKTIPDFHSRRFPAFPAPAPGTPGTAGNRRLSGYWALRESYRNRQQHQDRTESNLVGAHVCMYHAAEIRRTYMLGFRPQYADCDSRLSVRIWYETRKWNIYIEVTRHESKV